MATTLPIHFEIVRAVFRFLFELNCCTNTTLYAVIGLGFIVGIIIFVRLLDPLTDPNLYGSWFYHSSMFGGQPTINQG